jgi:predicted metal-binding protein
MTATARPQVVLCSTCKFAKDEPDDAEGVRGGQRLYEAMVAVAGRDPKFADVEVSQVECLWSCDQHCNIHLRMAGKCSYVAGRFTPDEATALAILEFALAYGASDIGAVPYRQWPQGMKGHFITRSPPTP